MVGGGYIPYATAGLFTTIFEQLAMWIGCLIVQVLALLSLTFSTVSSLAFNQLYSRRSALTISGASWWTLRTQSACGNPTTTTTTTDTALVTDKVYFDIATPSGEKKRLVVGLFGKEAPASVQKIKQLVSNNGLPAPCKPRAQRSLQKEQLEANKVYNSCIESEDSGVTLLYSTVWRIRPGERIDVGAVTGKFVARQYPNFVEDTTNNSGLRHDSPGVVSVRVGDESGFGFTVYPGGGDPSLLDSEHIVVGKVEPGESMETVDWLNAVPVVTTSSVNYMALTGAKQSVAPDRSCRYGGPMYCNENKPLVKLTVRDCGLLP